MTIEIDLIKIKKIFFPNFKEKTLLVLLSTIIIGLIFGRRFNFEMQFVSISFLIAIMLSVNLIVRMDNTSAVKMFNKESIDIDKVDLYVVRVIFTLLLSTVIGNYL